MAAQENVGALHSELPLDLSAWLRDALLDAGIRALTVVQSRVLVPVLRGQDVCACAPTGSGKTLAYAVPLAQAHAPGDAPGVRVLVFLPTRELAQQVSSAVLVAAAPAGVRCLLCAGGASLEAQEASLRGGDGVSPHWVIGTPGRLRDLAERRLLQLQGLRSVVLDEADRLLDEGLVHDTSAVLRLCPAGVQTLMLSATWTSEVDKFAGALAGSAHRVQVSAPDGGAVGGSVTHLALLCPRDRVTHTLMDAHAAWAAPHGSACLVFCATRAGAQALAAVLPPGPRHACLHGAMRQEDRDAALAALRSGALDVLVATDVAARGLDVPRVTLVVHADLPGDADTYIHRAGRAGRPGSAAGGTSLVLYQPHQGTQLPELERSAAVMLQRITSLDDASAAAPRRTCAQHAQSVALGERLLVTDRLSILNADLAELGAVAARRNSRTRGPTTQQTRGARHVLK
jgi:hypothetical protein